MNLDLFWSRVDRRSEQDCWPWIGPRLPKGYGHFKQGGSRTKYAHRIMWTLHHGKIPDGLLVCHRCDNPNCVNPHHLFLGTYRDNNRDALQKGRHYTPGLKGEAHGMAKVTEAQVREMRALYATGAYTQRSLADRYGLKKPQVSCIIRRERWKHVA